MKLTYQVKLQSDSSDELLGLLHSFNSACNWLSEVAFKERLFHWHPLQKKAYHELRERFGLPASATLVLIRKVAYAYKNRRRRKNQAHFKPLGAIPLFKHRYYKDGTVSFYGHRLSYKVRPDISLPLYPEEGRLLYREGSFYIHQAVEVAEPEPYEPKDFLGCDLGIKSILVDSEGENYSGGYLNGIRKRIAKLRARLQSKGTKSAKRLLKKWSIWEKRFARDINHQIAKRVVAKAKGRLLALVLENLRGIREKIKVRKAHRRQHHSWAFFQLRFFIEYKARLAGVPIILVDPRNTSRTCPACGHISPRNRSVQAVFCCEVCGFGGPADFIAAVNIRRARGDEPNSSPTRVGLNPLLVKGG